MEVIESLKRIVLNIMQRPYKSLIKGYLIFAIAHILWKFKKRIKELARAKRLLSHLPNGESLNFLKFDWFGNDTTKNFKNYFDHRTKIPLSYPKESLVVGTGPFVEVFCNDATSIKHLLKDDFNSFTKPAPGDDYLLQLMYDFLGENGLFTLQHGKGLGDPILEEKHKIWFNQRKSGSKIFTKSSFSNLMLETFNKKGKVMKAMLHKNENSLVDMQECFFRFTFDSIQEIFFGLQIDTVSGKDDDIYAKAYDGAHRSMVEIFLKYTTIHVGAQMYLPYPFGTLGDKSSGWSLSMEFIRRFTTAGQEFSRHTKVLQNETLKLIRNAKSDPNLKNRRDLLANFINSDVDYNEQELVDICLNFIIAGRDTTACTLSWLFYRLSSHPEIQKQVKDEVNKALNGSNPTYEKMNELPFLSACIFETLRMNPPVPEDYKLCTKDSTFPCGTIIPKGAKVLFHNFTMGKNPEIYENPLEFKPNRWLDHKTGQLKQKNFDDYQTPVFQGGTRKCLGADMALLEIKALVSVLVSDTNESKGLSFEISETEKKNVTWALMITQAISNNQERTSHNLWLTPHC